MLGTVLVLGTASAATPDASEKCRFDDQIAGLAALATHTDGSLDAVRMELALRKAILKNVVGCSIDEVQTLKASVKTVPQNDADIADVENRFAGKLDDMIAYYNTQAAKIDDLGIWGSKDMARAIAEKRSGAFVPLTEEAAEFVIWAKNQDLFHSASIRLTQIQNTLKFLRLIDNQETTGLLQKATDTFARAEDLNAQAKQALKNFDISNNSLSLIKDSLEALSETYQSFFDISTSLAVPQ